MKDPEKILTKGTESALNNLPIDYGKLRFTTDTARIFLDLKDKRIEFTDIIRNYKEAEIKKIVAPLPKLYLSSDTHKLFYYENGWISISGGSNTSGGTTIDAYTKTETDTLLTDKVDKESGKGLLADTDKTKYDDAVSKAHEHSNSTVLDKFNEDADGNPTYNGNAIGGGSSFSGNAIDVNYDNSTSGLVSIEVQSAIDELAAKYKDIDNSATKIELGDVTDANVVESGMFSTKLTWTDPEDIMASGVALAEWGGTRVVRKEGSIPTSVTDGILVIDSKTRNQYKTNEFEDTGLTSGVKYYYRFFPYTTKKIYTNGTALTITLGLIKISDVPVQKGTLTYNSKLQTASFDNFDTDKLIVSGNTGTDAGTYTATFTPKAGYSWSDSTTIGKSVTWTINKAKGRATLSTTSVTLKHTATSATITVTNNTGNLAVMSSDTNIATATVSNGKITINSVNNTKGTATITLTVSASSNYESASITISVTCNFLKIVTWADGTDDEIAAMIEAYYNGEIDIEDYWSVGDTRTIQLNSIASTGVDESHVAQNQKFVIIGIKHDKLKSHINGWSRAAITIQPLRVLSNGTSAESGYMNNTKIDDYCKWGSCDRRTWCNNVFINAFPSKIKSLIKTVEKRCATGINSKGICISETRYDKAFFLSEYEIFGENTNSIPKLFNKYTTEEGDQYEYYKTSSNRIKYSGNATAQGSACNWWGRSGSKSKTYFCSVYTSGSPNVTISNKTAAICPAVCL